MPCQVSSRSEPMPSDPCAGASVAGTAGGVWVSSSREVRVGVLADERRVGKLGARRVGGPVHEPEQVAGVEVAEARRLVDDRGRVAEDVEELALELEGHVLALGADVEQEVAGRRRCRVHGSVDRRERVQVQRPVPGGQPVPQRAPDPDDARQPSVEVPEADVLDEIAERESGASTLCASIGTRSHAPSLIVAPARSRPSRPRRAPTP
jgi:hypothetical protein